MKYIVIGIVSFFLLWGVAIATTTRSKTDDSNAIKRYVKSRGAAPVPRSWKGKIGDGI